MYPPTGPNLYLPLGDMSLFLLLSAISILYRIELAVTRSAVPVSRSVSNYYLTNTKCIVFLSRVDCLELTCSLKYYNK